MHRHLLTKHFLISLFFLLPGLNGVAFAQIYKSYDANGNVVFSDKPSKRSSEVEVSTPNLSDSFEIPPPTEPPSETDPESAPEPEAVSEPEPEVQSNTDNESADTNNDGRVSRREKEKQREEKHKRNRAAAKAAEENEE